MRRVNRPGSLSKQGNYLNHELLWEYLQTSIYAQTKLSLNNLSVIKRKNDRDCTFHEHLLLTNYLIHAFYLLQRNPKPSLILFQSIINHHQLPKVYVRTSYQVPASHLPDCRGPFCLLSWCQPFVDKATTCYSWLLFLSFLILWL